MRRDYTKVGKTEYTREEVDKAISSVEWEAFRGDNLPFCQGEALKKAIKEFKIPISKISRMCLHGQMKEHHGFYGLDVDYKNARVQMYIADNGCSICVVACDVWEKEAVAV